MRGIRAAAATACLLVACGGDDQSAEAPDAAPDVTAPLDAPRPLDVITPDASAPDTSVDLPAPDAPLDAPRDAVVDVARDVSVDIARDVVVDVPRDTPVDVTERVPLPSDVMSGDSCRALLRRIGIRFTVASATRGIVDPVTVTTPINGVSFHSTSLSTAERPLLMDCRLAVALWHLTDALRTRWNITDVAHLGIYNYRVIAGTTTLSQHSYATAIDLALFRAQNGTTYSVLTDFTMNGQPTCPPRTTGPRDRVLKEIACWMYDSRAFHIILTPNYNADHRNHFHVDLSSGAHTIRFGLPGGVDPEHHPFFDLFYDDF